MKYLLIILSIFISIFAFSDTLNGTLNPASGLGTNGDYYIKINTWEIFGPKTNNQWGKPFNIRGKDISIIDTNNFIYYKNKNNSEIYLGTNILKIDNNFTLNDNTNIYANINRTNLSLSGPFKSNINYGASFAYTNETKNTILFNCFIIEKYRPITNGTYNFNFENAPTAADSNFWPKASVWIKINNGQSNRLFGQRFIPWEYDYVSSVDKVYKMFLYKNTFLLYPNSYLQFTSTNRLEISYKIQEL